MNREGKGAKACGTENGEPQSGVEGHAGVEEEEDGVISRNEGEGAREPIIIDLAGILQAHMGQQDIHEARLKEDEA